MVVNRGVGRKEKKKTDVERQTKWLVAGNKGDIRSRIGITAVVLWTFGCHDGNHNSRLSTRYYTCSPLGVISKLNTLSLVIEADFHTYVRFVGKCDDVGERALSRSNVSVRSFSLSRTILSGVVHRTTRSLFCFCACFVATEAAR